MAGPKLIQPRTLKGFRDFLPAAMMSREHLIDTAKRVYRSYGFAPIDTPVLEHLEILQGKGSDETDRQMYKFEDNGGRPVGMRFDLTIPLARYAAQHFNELGTPFKRYHVAKVWRGENAQRGRYREFMQCDFDTIGTTAIASDIETVLVVHDLMLAIGITGFEIRVNNRKVLTGLLDKLSLAEHSTQVLRCIDKLPKIGRDKVAAEMATATSANEDQVNQVLRLAEIKGDSPTVLRDLTSLVSGSAIGEAGVSELTQLVEAVSEAGMPDERLLLDVSIARGLDYYTGTILETFLTDLPTIGSVCSGGRYDNLAGLYTKQSLPGIGASLGLDRLLAALEELKITQTAATPADVLIPFFDSTRLHDYLRIAAELRAQGIAVEVYPEPKKLGAQLKYADRKGFAVAIIIGGDEFDAGVSKVKNLKEATSEDVKLSDGCAELAESIKRTIKS